MRFSAIFVSGACPEAPLANREAPAIDFFPICHYDNHHGIVRHDVFRLGLEGGALNWGPSVEVLFFG